MPNHLLVLALLSPKSVAWCVVPPDCVKSLLSCVGTPLVRKCYLVRIRSPLASRRNSLGCCRSHNALHYPATLPSASNHVLSRVARWNVARLAAEFARVRTPGDSSIGVTSLSSSRVDVPLHRCDRDGRDPTSWCTTVRWSSRRHAFYDRMIVAGAYGSTYAYPGTHGHRVLSSDPKSVACVFAARRLRRFVGMSLCREQIQTDETDVSQYVVPSNCAKSPLVLALLSSESVA